MPHGQQTIGWRGYETRGQPIRAQAQEVTPISRVVQITWPGGGLIWHRPVAVEVHRTDGVMRLPIQNLTRRALMVCYIALSMGVLALMLTQWKSLRERTSSR